MPARADHLVDIVIMVIVVMVSGGAQSKISWLSSRGLHGLSTAGSLALE
jgi:hypothetical protein